MRRSARTGLAAAAVLCAGALVAHTDTMADTFPSHPIRLLTSAAGGGNDFAARIIAQGLTPRLGQPVIVENRGGAGGAIAAETVAKSPPDGHTLLFYGSNIWLLPFLRRNVPYDPVKDFAPVTLAVRAPAILVVHPSVPARSVRELVALAKKAPGKLTYGAGSAGSATYIATELFKEAAGVKILHVPYKGSGPVLTALISGEIDMAFATPGSVAAHIKAGRLRALAVTSAEPSPLLPGLPTVASGGLPGYEAQSIVGVFAPAGTPKAIVDRLQAAFHAVLQEPDVKVKFFSVGVEPVGSSAEAFGRKVKSEMARVGKVIRAAGIQD